MDPFNTDAMANDLLQQFANQAFTIDQQVIYELNIKAINQFNYLKF